MADSGSLGIPDSSSDQPMAVRLRNDTWRKKIGNSLGWLVILLNIWPTAQLPDIKYYGKVQDLTRSDIITHNA